MGWMQDGRDEQNIKVLLVLIHGNHSLFLRVPHELEAHADCTHERVRNVSNMSPGIYFVDQYSAALFDAACSYMREVLHKVGLLCKMDPIFRGSFYDAICYTC